jgi:hypothetical protein
MAFAIAGPDILGRGGSCFRDKHHRFWETAIKINLLKTINSYLNLSIIYSMEAT